MVRLGATAGGRYRAGVCLYAVSAHCYQCEFGWYRRLFPVPCFFMGQFFIIWSVFYEALLFQTMAMAQLTQILVNEKYY